VSAAFDRLSPAMQYQIANGLGFSALRPVQEQTIHAVLDGDNAVVLAPTAGGKTEAAFFPLLSRMDTEDWRPISTLYLSPIRALLNNQEARLERYASLIGRRAALWHGDTAQAARRRIAAEPPDILLTTPESLEVMLISPRVPARRLFAGLEAVVIDEVHAFVGDDRGGHLAAVLERLGRLSGRDAQRIGLSATVGNPDEILAWLAGSSARPGRVVAPQGRTRPPELALDYVGSIDNAAKVIRGLHRGEKRLVFVDSRRQVEALGEALRALAVDTHVLHSSLSADARQHTERQFAEGSNCVIVATSSLELGIDIGDLDRVVQIDAPPSVASFLQRMGRTGRRPGATANCTFLATEPWALLQSAALLHLHGQGYVEPVHPVRRAAHLYVHQLLALTLQEHGLPEHDAQAWVGRATPFQDLTAAELLALTTHLVTQGYLTRTDGRLLLGPQGERDFGRRNFQALYAVFDTPQQLTVRFGPKEIGAIEASFVAAQPPSELSFKLGARAWQATWVDWSKAQVHVVPTAAAAKAPRWRGQPRWLSQRLCQAMRHILSTDAPPPAGTQRATARLTALREEHGETALHGGLVDDTASTTTWWNFAGGRANTLLAQVLETALGPRVTASNLSLRFHDDAAQSHAAIASALQALAEADRPNEADARAHAETCARARLSKFQPCLPPAMETDLLAARLLDVGEAQAAVRGLAMDLDPPRRPVPPSGGT
jgi:ATP-dependent Lhr-like helicase